MARLIFVEKDKYRKDNKYYHVSTHFFRAVKWTQTNWNALLLQAKKDGSWRSVRLYLDKAERKWWEDPDVVVAWVGNFLLLFLFDIFIDFYGTPLWLT